jgi:hypothetical protein
VISGVVLAILEANDDDRCVVCGKPADQSIGGPIALIDNALPLNVCTRTCALEAVRVAWLQGHTAYVVTHGAPMEVVPTDA